MKIKQCAVLGLGVFGSTVATTLEEEGVEVLAIDNDLSCVDRVVVEVTKAVQADVTDLAQLEELGIGEFDAAVVALSNHLEESILAILHLKELGVPLVIAKAKNKTAKMILEKVGADRVIRAEKEMGVRVGRSLTRTTITDFIELNDRFAIVEITVPKEWVGKNLAQLDVRQNYNMNVLGYKKRDAMQLDAIPDSQYVFNKGDKVLVMGEVSKIRELDTEN